jgi:hypothetical protein
MKKRLRKKLEKRFSAPVNDTVEVSSAFTSDHCKTLAVEIWRLKRSFKALPAGLYAGSFGVSIDRLEELLRTLGVEIHDPTGELYDEGMTVSVSLFETSKLLPSGVKRIADTIAPTVYRKDKLLQPGKVIVEVGASEE